MPHFDGAKKKKCSSGRRSYFWVSSGLLDSVWWNIRTTIPAWRLRVQDSAFPLCSVFPPPPPAISTVHPTHLHVFVCWPPISCLSLPSGHPLLQTRGHPLFNLRVRFLALAGSPRLFRKMRKVWFFGGRGCICVGGGMEWGVWEAFHSFIRLSFWYFSWHFAFNIAQDFSINLKNINSRHKFSSSPSFHDL